PLFTLHVSRLPPSYDRFYCKHPAPTEIYTLSLHDALPILALDGPPARIWRRPAPARHPTMPCSRPAQGAAAPEWSAQGLTRSPRSEEHTSELQSPDHLVCRLLLEKKKKRR